MKILTILFLFAAAADADRYGTLNQAIEFGERREDSTPPYVEEAMKGLTFKLARFAEQQSLLTGRQHRAFFEMMRAVIKRLSLAIHEGAQQGVLLNFNYLRLTTVETCSFQDPKTLRNTVSCFAFDDRVENAVGIDADIARPWVLRVGQEKMYTDAQTLASVAFRVSEWVVINSLFDDIDKRLLSIYRTALNMLPKESGFLVDGTRGSDAERWKEYKQGLSKELGSYEKVYVAPWAYLLDHWFSVRRETWEAHKHIVNFDIPRLVRHLSSPGTIRSLLHSLAELRLEEFVHLE